MASSSSSGGLGNLQPGDADIQARGDLARTLGNWTSESVSFSRNLMTLGRNTESNLAALNQLNTEDNQRVFRFSSEYLGLSGRDGIIKWTFLSKVVDLLARGDLVLLSLIHI